MYCYPSNYDFGQKKMAEMKDSDKIDVYVLNNHLYLICPFKNVYLNFTEDGYYLCESTLESILEEIENSLINPIPMEMEFGQFKELFLNKGE